MSLFSPFLTKPWNSVLKNLRILQEESAKFSLGIVSLCGVPSCCVSVVAPTSMKWPKMHPDGRNVQNHQTNGFRLQKYLTSEILCLFLLKEMEYARLKIEHAMTNA